MNRVNYLEEELSKKWKLSSADDIVRKIFEGEEKNTQLAVSKLLDDAKILVACSYSLGRILAQDVRLRANSLRKFYEALMSIRAKLREMEDIKVKDSVLLIKPYLAYEESRKRREIEPLFKVLNRLLERVFDKTDYLKLCQFVEATIAYHKYHGGRD